MSDTFYWSPNPAFSDRLILPFWYNTKIVGYTARRITNNRPKYLSEQHPHFVFNLDAQDPLNRYVFVTEGPFDALSINGVALLTNNIADQQARMINRLGKEVIVIPDQDTAGLAVIKRAIEYGWSVAFPTWEPDIKDCADAVLRYGKLFVIVDVIKTAERHEATIRIKMKHLEQQIRSLHGN
jgi:DNA primase